MRNRVGWLGIQVEVPGDWEIIRHSTQEKAGRLIFADRRYQRLQFAWTWVEQRPYEKRIFEDFRARDKQENPSCILSPVYRTGRWQAYTRTVRDTIITRAGSYDKRVQRWYDLVFSWPGERDEKVERFVLESYCSEKKESSDSRWCAFGLDFTLPKTWQIDSAKVDPGRIRLVFTQGDNRITVRRRALASFWYKGDIENFLKNETKHRSGRIKQEILNNHTGGYLKAKEKIFKLRWLWGKRLITDDCAWLCDKRETLFHVTAESYANRPVSTDIVKVNCC